jgi:hypothetical protein
MDFVEKLNSFIDDAGKKIWTGAYKVGEKIVNYVVLIGCKLEEQKTNADAVDNVITFAENITAIEIYHAESTWQQFTVNGITLNIPAGGYRTPIGGTPGATVTIPAGVDCIVGRLV